MKIRIVISGRGYPTTETLPEELTLPAAATVKDAIGELERMLPPAQQLPSSCLVAVSGDHLGTLGSYKQRSLAEGDELVLIAPVAGG